MSNTPGISPLTTDIEEIRPSDDSSFDEIDKDSGSRPEIDDEMDDTGALADLPVKDSGAP
jgi:hypothetical protein